MYLITQITCHIFPKHGIPEHRFTFLYSPVTFSFNPFHSLDIVLTVLPYTCAIIITLLCYCTVALAGVLSECYVIKLLIIFASVPCMLKQNKTFNFKGLNET